MPQDTAENGHLSSRLTLVLRQQHGFDGNDIETIRLGIPRIIQGRLTNPHPVDLQAAQMCLPFSVALAAKVAFCGEHIPALTVSDYEAGLRDRSLFELEDRTTIEPDEEVEAMSNERSTATRVGARLRDGHAFSVLVGAPKGSPSRPFSAEEHEARFAQELSCRISHQRCAEIVVIAKDLDRLDASQLCGMLCGA